MERKKISNLIDASILSKIYDFVRYVNPIVKETSDSPIHGINSCISSEGACYEFWKTGSTCENCISMRALRENRVIIKLEYNRERLYLVTAVPSDENGELQIIELLKDVTDQNLIESFGSLDIDQIHEKVRQLNLEIVSDPLTGLYNRRFLEERLPLEIARVASNKLSLNLMMVDIDYFKVINDTYGHHVGDQVLKEFAEILRHGVRAEMDWVVRYGGEEFMIFLAGAESCVLQTKAEMLRKELSLHAFSTDAGVVRLTASFGLCSCTPPQDVDVKDTATYIRQADEALYLAKNSGRNKVCLYSGDPSETQGLLLMKKPRM